MPFLQSTSSFVSGGAYHFALVALLCASVLLGLHVWRRRPSPESRLLWVGPAVLLVVIVLWVALGALFRLSDLPSYLWAGPFDRLLIATCVLALAWAMSLGRGDARWRLFVAGGLALAVLAYAGWAPLWARELQRYPMAASDPTGLARPWDAVQALLAIVVAAAVWRRGPSAPRWLVAAVALMALGGLLNLAMPAGASVPVWSRLGALGAAVSLTLVTASQAAGVQFDVARESRRTVDRGRLRLLPQSELAASRLDADAGAPSEPAIGGADAVAERLLRQTAAQLGAGPACFGVIGPTGDLDVWAIASARSEPRRAVAVPLTELPTVQAALTEGTVVVRSTRSHPDVWRLLAQAGPMPKGSVALQRVGAARPLGVVVAAKRRGGWSGWQVSRLTVLAARAAASLEAVARQDAAMGQAARAMGAVEAQGAALTRLGRSMEEMSQRLAALESRPENREASEPVVGERRALGPSERPAGAAVRGGSGVALSRGYELSAPRGSGAGAAGGSGAGAEGGTGAGAAGGSGAGAAGFAERLSRYEGALDRLPWGVMVADAAGAVAFVNGAARRLLHRDHIDVGSPVCEAFPDPERMALAVAETRSARSNDARQVLFEVPRVRVEVEPLRGGSGSYLGAVVVVRPHDGTGASSSEMLPQVVEALRAPISSIMGYSDLLARGAGLGGEQLERFLQRIDANMSRMQLMLGNLLTILELEAGPGAGAVGEVDVVAAMRRAIARARPQLDEKALTVDVDAGERLPRASVEEGSLDLMLDNLLANAAQRSPQGGDIRLTARAVDDGIDGSRVILIGFQDRGHQLRGAPGSVREIDDVDASTVALRLVRVLASAQGGRAWVTSDSGGATFQLRLAASGARSVTPEARREA